MPQEPRSFFERITGAKLMSGTKEELEDDSRVEVEDFNEEGQAYEQEVVTNEEDDIDGAMTEDDYEAEDNYSDESLSQEEEQEGAQKRRR